MHLSVFGWYWSWSLLDEGWEKLDQLSVDVREMFLAIGYQGIETDIDQPSVN